MTQNRNLFSACNNIFKTSDKLSHAKLKCTCQSGENEQPRYESIVKSIKDKVVKQN